MGEYKEEFVYHLLEDYGAIKNDFFLAPDDDLRIGLLDIEIALKKIAEIRIDHFGTFNEKELAKMWVDGNSVKKIAKKMNCNERKVYREKWRLAKKITGFLNGEAI